MKYASETLDVFLPAQHAGKASCDDSVQSFLKVRNIQCLVGSLRQPGSETLDVFLPAQHAEKACRDDSVQLFLKVRNIQCLVRGAMASKSAITSGGEMPNSIQKKHNNGFLNKWGKGTP